MIEDEGRLRWMCRRGMLELDVLFERFINNNGFDSLTPEQRTAFEAMMQEPDPVLYNWLLGAETPDPKFAECIQAVLDHQR